MFTQKKDEEIEALHAQVKTLTQKVTSLETSWLNCRQAHHEVETKLLSSQKKRDELQDYYSNEDARLRRMIKSEKTRRKDSKSASARKIRKLEAALEAQKV